MSRFFLKKRIHFTNKKAKRISKSALFYITNKTRKYSYSLIDLLIKLGVYKIALLLKLIFIVSPFIVLTIVDNFVVAFIMTIMNIFLCAIFFSFATVSKSECIVNGEFDFGLYQQKKAKRETVVIVITFGTVLLSIFIGHYIVTDIISWMLV